MALCASLRQRGTAVPLLACAALQSTDFCYTPLGQNGGDPDRYGAAIMFGCLPVMLNSSEYQLPRVRRAIPNALPLEEVLPWHTFATIM